ncbi:MAG: hypothetical protein HFJ44_07180 [Clostridia bacterium]|jgi:hypothetical protein|nr:hypothetical protein [Clostridia bacterium]
MNFNKNVFSKHFKDNDYDFCAEMLRSSIIDFLVDKIKLKKPDYKYSTITFLKNDCFTYLEPVYQDMAVQLYTFSFNEEPSEYELSRMMEMYQYLIVNDKKEQ